MTATNPSVMDLETVCDKPGCIPDPELVVEPMDMENVHDHDNHMDGL